MPCATPPWICPSTKVGLIARPTSCAAAIFRTLTVPSSRSIARSAICRKTVGRIGRALTQCVERAGRRIEIPWPSSTSPLSFRRQRRRDRFRAVRSSDTTITVAPRALRHPRRWPDGEFGRCAWHGQLVGRLARHKGLARGRCLASVRREVGIAEDQSNSLRAAGRARRRRICTITVLVPWPISTAPLNS